MFGYVYNECICFGRIVVRIRCNNVLDFIYCVWDVLKFMCWSCGFWWWYEVLEFLRGVFF